MGPSDIHVEPAGRRVCVVGAGVIGLVAVKNLTEQGLLVTAYERNAHIGGNWLDSHDPDQVCALPETTTTNSKHELSFSDFPMGDDYPLFPSATDVERYLEAYAQHFDLLQYLRLCTVVTDIKRDHGDSTWLVKSENCQTGAKEAKHFDRLVLATGVFNTKRQPRLEGSETFAGKIMHSREFKNPNEFAGKNVVIVGAGQTGADTLCHLKNAGAKKLYLSHRTRFFLLPATIRGYSLDHYMTGRAQDLLRFFLHMSPGFTEFMVTKATRMLQNSSFPFMKNHPSTPATSSDGNMHRLPIVCDSLPYLIRDGHVETRPALRCVKGPRSLVCTDGMVIDDIDAVIFCTGYHYNMSLIDGVGSPCDPRFAPDKLEGFEKAHFRDPQDRFPRLYHGIISEAYPESLAILGHMIILKAVPPTYDLATMALASFWSDKRHMPDHETMKQEINARYKTVVKILERGPMPIIGLRLDCKETYEWMNRMAGTGLTERLSWSWQGWRFWWKNKKLVKMLRDGVNTSAAYRLFDTGRGRKPWKGAENAIMMMNAEAMKLHKRWEEEQRK